MMLGLLIFAIGIIIGIAWERATGMHETLSGSQTAEPPPTPDNVIRLQHKCTSDRCRKQP